MLSIAMAYLHDSQGEPCTKILDFVGTCLAIVATQRTTIHGVAHWTGLPAYGTYAIIPAGARLVASVK